jgi:hypothetical protein
MRLIYSVNLEQNVRSADRITEGYGTTDKLKSESAYQRGNEVEPNASA